MGKSQGSQKVTNKTELPSWYTGPAKAMMDQAQAAAANIAKPYQGNTVAGLDPITQQAVSYTGANMGSTNAGYSAAQRGASQAMNYTPQMVGSGYSPMSVGVGSQGYDYQPTNVSAGSFLSGNIGAYMNPYTQQVENAARGNLDRAYKQNLNTIGDSAINANAFGGSRQGVAEGVAASENARQMGDLSAQLRSQAFTAGSNLMDQDFARSMQAQQFNAGQGMQNSQFGANLGLQNLQNQLQAQQSNQNAGLQGAQLNQQAALANQQAGLQGSQLNLQAADQLGSLTGQGQTAYLQGLQSAVAAGQINQEQAQQLLNQDVTRYDAMANIPAQQLNLMLAALGGTQVPTTSTQKTPTSGNWLTGAAGGALAGASMGPWGMLGGGILGGIAGA